METWSQMMARMPRQGVAASIGGPTTPGTATAELQEQGVPPHPPGLLPLDFTNWSLPFPEAPATGGLPTPLGGPPSIGGQTVGPWALGQKAPALPMQVLSTPQGMLPVHQLRLHQPTTLISRQCSCRASPLLLMSRWHSHQASLLPHTSRLCSHPGDWQGGDC